ncbi:hypothetical protein SK128_005502 [Halocaridina rubra]|uniref:C2H2-type domain-containing protein n=1 Tax=Halocaridina rubra TaxID=373956 RepID=A0AAN8WWS4_HALRR
MSHVLSAGCDKDLTCFQDDGEVNGRAMKLPRVWILGSGTDVGGCLSSAAVLQQQQQLQVEKQQHQHSLAEQRPYACPYCGRRFKRSDHRRQHERLHTGEKPYVCTKCGAKYPQQSGLHYHKLNSCRDDRRDSAEYF